MKRKNDEIDIILGEIICKARIKKGLTMDQLARRIGAAGRSAINHYEKGQRTMRIDVFIKICRILDLDYEKVLKDVAKQI